MAGSKVQGQTTGDLMKTKLSKLKALWAAGDRMAALRMAARFPRLGNQKTEITQAWAAANNPGFYRQLGKNPEELIETGITALMQRYEL